MSIVKELNLEIIEVDGSKVAGFVVPHYGVEEINKFWQLQKNNELCDATLNAEIDDTKVVVHRALLSLVSKYFLRIFKENSSKQVFPLKDITGIVLKQIVEFIYTGKILLTETNVMELFKHSREYELLNLTSACEKFYILNLKPNNFMEYKKIAVDNECFELWEAIETFEDKSFEAIQKSDALHDMTIDQLKELLSRDSLQSSSEESVFAAVEKWVAFSPQDRAQYLMELLPYIRFAFLTPKFITDHAALFNTSVDAMLFCIKAAHWHYLTDAEKELGEFNTTKRNYLPQIDADLPLNKIGDVDESKNDPIACTNTGIYSYNVATRSWTKVHRFGDGTIECVSIHGNKVFGYMKGTTFDISSSTDNSLVLIDLADNSSSGRMLDRYLPGYRSQPALCAVNDNVYVIGGWKKSGDEKTRDAFVLETVGYNARLLTFPLVFSRALATAVHFKNCIYVVGGYHYENTDTIVEKLDILSEKWSSVAPLLVKRLLPKCVVHGNLLYAIGGIRNSSAECYDPETNRWKMIARLPFEGVSCAIIIEDQIVAVAHEGRAMTYNKAKNSWNDFKRAEE